MLIKAKEFDPEVLSQYRIIKKGRKKGSKSYIDLITAVDIETTRLADIEQSFMYIWQYQIGKDITVIGRTWDEFLDMLEKIKDWLDGRAWLVTYIHNASYEFTFIKGVYDFEPDEVFVTDPRKVLKFTMFDAIEFRCSYFLTNMSLASFLKKYGAEDQKLSGDIFDYTKVRYPWTELTDYEIQYCINDVKGLVQALYRSLAVDGDDVSTVPLTATGYVRRDMKAAMRRGYNHKQLKAMLPDKEIYLLLREAFRGGNTMSNRYYTDMIIEDVGSADMVSSYPASLMTRPYPMTPFFPEKASVRTLRRLLKEGMDALLMRVTFRSIELKNIMIGDPYIPKDKCRDLIGFTNSNGRILRADQLSISLTDIDFRIIQSMYKWKAMKVTTLYSATYHMLPLCFRNTVMQFYKVKTELKGVPEDSEEYGYYMRNKEKLNSTYGMCVQAVQDEIRFINNDFVYEDRPLEDLIEEHNRTAFLAYQWGVFCTAWSRLALQEGIDLCGKNAINFVYCDTDSVKYVGDVDFSELNARREQLATDCGAYAVDRNGEAHYMGVYEDEGYKRPNRFATMGAKKYVLEDSDKNLHITIAGVNKRKGGKELGSIENFKEGFIFNDAGGTESIFNDNVYMSISIGDHTLTITDNVVIRDSTYTLGITQEYRDILDGLVDIKYSDHDIAGYYKVKK